LDDCVDGTLWRKVGLGETTTMLKGATLNPLNPVSCLAPLKSSAENVNKNTHFTKKRPLHINSEHTPSIHHIHKGPRDFVTGC